MGWVLASTQGRGAEMGLARCCVLHTRSAPGVVLTSLSPPAAPGLRVPVRRCLRLDDVRLHCGHDIQHHLPHHRPLR